MKAEPRKLNILWLTPQQVDAARHALREREALNRSAVKVRSIPALQRPQSSDENAETQNLLSNAKDVVAAALAQGWAVRHVAPPLPSNIPCKHVRSELTRRRMRLAKRRLAKNRKMQTT